MASSHIVFVVAGLLILAVAWLPLFLRNRPLSMPMAALGAGVVASGGLAAAGLRAPFRDWAEHLALLAVIVSVMGAGLKIDRPFGWKRWNSTWRLIGIAMPITIVLGAVAAHVLLGLPAAHALLLAAILAPTDPVLAGEVQVGPPGSGENNEVRFALTTEAGLNDGLAFPFVLLALAAVDQGFGAADAWAPRWALVDFAWNVTGGALTGFLIARALLFIENNLPEGLQLRSTRQNLIVLGLSFLAYGAAEAANANGIVAVFATAVTVRNLTQSVDYPRQLVEFTAEIEELVLAVVLLNFGAAIAAGILGPVTWREAIFVTVALLLIRPLAMLATWIGSAWTLRQRLLAGFFGIKGLASLYYVAYAAGHSELRGEDDLIGIVSLTILASIVLYGVSSNLMSARLNRYDRPAAAAPPERPIE